MRWYVYVLRSLKNGTLYVGRTDDVSRRLQEHNAGKGGFYTSQNRPYELMYFEMFLNTRDACAEERFLKSGYGRGILRNEKISHLLLEGAG